MTSFCPDLLRVRVSPQPTWRRHERTWNEIMDEIDLHDLTRRVDKLEEQMLAATRLIRQACALSLCNQQLIGDILHSQTLMINKLGDRGAVNDDRV